MGLPVRNQFNYLTVTTFWAKEIVPDPCRLVRRSAISSKGMPRKWQVGGSVVPIPLPYVLEVIPMTRSKAYRAVAVKHVSLDTLLAGRTGCPARVGLDISK